MKHTFRQQLKEKRSGISPGLYAEKSKKITEQLLHLSEYLNAEHILFYVSTPEEVDTHSAIKEALTSGKKVYVPKIVGDILAICPIYDFHQLEPGEYGILEPCKNSETAEALKMDLIVIPGVGFDHRGHRLGHGKGHYDRLLKATRGFKVGLAFEEQLVPELPIEEHDVPVDALLTDQNLLYFKHS